MAEGETGVTGGWRGAVEAGSRAKVVEHFLGKLRALHAGGPEQEMRAVLAEEAAFGAAVGWEDYLRRIAADITAAQEAAAPLPSSPPPPPPSAPSAKRARAASMTPGAWRAQLRTLERVEMCRRVLTEVREAYPAAEKRIARDFASSVEYRAFRAAPSRDRYVQMIAASVLDVQTQAQKTVAAPPPSSPPPAAPPAAAAAAKDEPDPDNEPDPDDDPGSDKDPGVDKDPGAAAGGLDALASAVSSPTRSLDRAPAPAPAPPKPAPPPRPALASRADGVDVRRPW